MARMLPNRIAPEVESSAERRVFEWLANDPAADGWTVLHSLGLARHEKLLFGEVDFVVLAPDCGIFCLEVKGGRVAREDGVWRFTNKYGETGTKERGPFDQAREGMFALMREVKKRFGDDPAYATLLFGYGAIFPDIDFDVEGPDYDPLQAWGHSACQSRPISDFVMQLAACTQTGQQRVYGRGNRRTPPSREQVDAIAEMLRGDFDRPMLLAAQMDEAEESLARLTREQFRCLDMLEGNERLVVEGSAGTGKTLLAVELARRAMEGGEKVAFFCFNAALAAWTREQLAGHVAEGSHVGTLHAFMVAHDAGAPAAYDNDYFSHALPRSLVAKGALPQASFDRLVVDEAQDLVTEDYLPVLDRILRGGLAQGRWSFFGDFARQAIYQDERDEGRLLGLLGAHAPFARAKLSLNCRNTRNIGEQARLLSGLASEFPEGAAEGPRVTYLLWRNEDEEARMLAEVLTELLQEGVRPDDVAILTPGAPDHSIAARCSLPVPVTRAQEPGAVRLSSIAAFKGLESRAVVIVDCTSYANFRLYYVGVTRAKAKLYILESNSAHRQRAALAKGRARE